MVKVRFDIIVATFLIFILVILGNSFININKSFYESLEDEGVLIGYPANSDTTVVTTAEELALATEYGEPFAITVDSDNIEKTNYYSQLNGTNTVEKKSGFYIWLNRALGGNYYDRIYIVELADGQRVPVLMLDGVLDLSADTVTLPVGEAEFLFEEADYWETLDKEFDLSENNAEQWYVNASGKDMTLFTDYTDKTEALKTINWIIVGVAFILYTMISTACIHKSHKRNSD